MNICVVGTGYVGLVVGTCMSDLGFEVTCADNDPDKIDALLQSRVPIYEPGLEPILRRNVREGRLRFTLDTAAAIAAADVVYIAVGTPGLEDGHADLSGVDAVSELIGRHMSRRIVAIIKSTVPVGTADRVREIIGRSARYEFDVVSNPEFLREGSAIYDTLNPDRIVIGAKSRDAAVKLVELYAPIEKPMIITDLESAEMIKYASNSLLATKISFINAISRLCELTGANVADVAKGVGADNRIGPQFLGAGLGWGGSCFPKDVQGLIKISERYGYDFRLLREAWNINSDQTQHFLRRIESRLGSLADKNIALLGLAFKPNTDDIRFAKSLEIIEYILERGGNVTAYDPVAAEHVKDLYPSVTYVDSVYEVSDQADALVLVTEWNEFKQIDLDRLGGPMRQRLLFDGRRVYSKQLAERAGFEYFTVGSS